MAKKWRGVLLLLLCASALRVHSSQEPPGQVRPLSAYIAYVLLWQTHT